MALFQVTKASAGGNKYTVTSNTFSHGNGTTPITFDLTSIPNYSQLTIDNIIVELLEGYADSGLQGVTGVITLTKTYNNGILSIASNNAYIPFNPGSSEGNVSVTANIVII